MIIRDFVISAFAGFAVLTAVVGSSSQLSHKLLYPTYPAEAIEPDSSNTLRYPIKDRVGDHITDKKKDPFYLPDPANIKKDVEYDPTSGKYIVTEKVGDQNIKEPLYLTYDEYLKYTEKQERDAYFKSRANAIQLIEEKGLIPSVDMKNPILDRLFGGTKIEINRKEI